ncbi:S-adenosyl-L-methionine-dependent methyltransferase [Xylariales sp. PMI_506]|nr:S-adenosyl-L-methionine-dependent methyltransferase [Xylariales sp. PMI_506]
MSEHVETEPESGHGEGPKNVSVAGSGGPAAASLHYSPAPNVPVNIDMIWAGRLPMANPPTWIYTEVMPVADPMLSEVEDFNFRFTKQDPYFALRANDLINITLGCTPTGGSVVEPDSVLGESGRLYHGYKDGKYFLPNDAAEQDRLDFQHQMFTIMLDGWFGLAPLDRVPSYVLDVATGTGLWALEFAEKYPTSFVIGTDLSKIQPNSAVLNCVFQRDDAEDEWVFRDPLSATPILFDYVHLRMVCTCFDDTRVVMRHAFNNMRPGGWIEFQDATFDITSADPDFQGSALDRWCKGCVLGAANTGRDILVPTRYKTWLEEIGFVNVTARPLILPCNPWPEDPKLKHVGYYQLTNMIKGLKGISWKMLQHAGYSAAEIEDLIRETQAYLQSPQNHPYATFWVVYGQKP